MSTDTQEAAPSRVRFAERCDYDQIMFICRELHGENGLFEMSDARVREVIDSHFDRTGGIIGVIGEPNALEGIIILRLGATWYSDQTVLEELSAFVLPEFRRSDNAKNLIDFAKECAKQIGVPLIIGVVSNHRTEAKVALYRRRLGAPAGAFFLANAGA